MISFILGTLTTDYVCIYYDKKFSGGDWPFHPLYFKSSLEDKYKFALTPVIKS